MFMNSLLFIHLVHTPFSHTLLSDMDIAKINFNFGKMFHYKVFGIVISQVLAILSCLNINILYVSYHTGIAPTRYV